MADVAILPKSKKQGIVFEQCHVQNVYDEIASRVNDIQHKAWPNVKRFMKKFEPGSLIADIGCGNGRYLNINKGVYKIGIDVCEAMVDNSREKGYEVGYADNLNIPFRDGMFDGVISIGVVHHFCSSERRLKALKELARVLRPGGKLMLYVWAYEQRHRKFDSQDVLVPWHEHKQHRMRTGSTSSRHSSLGGISSASSLSEDDSLDQPNQPTENGNHMPSKRCLQKQNSVSLDDLTCMTELSNFKPSYYSLDFTGSPRKGKPGLPRNSSDVGNVVKENVVSECQKLEASLRAMSLGSLEEINRLVTNTEFEEKASLDGGIVSDFSSQIIEENGKNMSEEDCLKSAPIETGEINRNESQCKCYLNESWPDKHTEEIGEKNRKSTKVNPFLKNSMDAYTVNNVLATLSTGDDFDSFVEIDEDGNETESLDEVFVNFKPEKQNGNVQGSSFITSIKSKFLKIFSDEKEVTSSDPPKPQNGKESNIVPNSSCMKTEKPQLTLQQQLMAEKLNFKVREFPQSSCPSLSEDDLGMQTRQKCCHSELPVCELTDSDRNQSDHKQATWNDSTSCSCRYKRSNQKHLPGAFREARSKCMKQDSNDNEVLSVIYDGYIKIDLEDRKETTPYCTSAFNATLNAKSNSAPNNDTSNCDTLEESGREMCNGYNHDLRNNAENGGQCNADNERNVSNDIKLRRPKQDSMDEEHCKKIQIIHSLSQEEEVEGAQEVDAKFSSKLCRYYHVFREGELETLINNHVKGLHILQCSYDHANWCIIAEKL